METIVEDVSEFEQAYEEALEMNRKKDIAKELAKASPGFHPKASLCGHGHPGFFKPIVI